MLLQDAFSGRGSVSQDIIHGGILFISFRSGNTVNENKDEERITLRILSLNDKNNQQGTSSCHLPVRDQGHNDKMR